MTKFNVIIPTAFKDFSFLPRVIKYVKKYIQPAKIIVILDTRLEYCIPKPIKHDKDVVVADENSLVEGVSFEKVKEYLRKHGSPIKRTGWFLQQFLKLGFANSSYCDTDYYLSWDADTLPLRTIKFFDTDNHPYFTKKFEHNDDYFMALGRMLDLDKYADFSFIAEHMMFNKIIMKEMLQEINKSKLKGINWVEKIINATISCEVNSFSEFETYGNYTFNRYPSLYNTRQLNTFRKAGYIAGRFITDRKLGFMGFDLDTASFELGDYATGLNKPATFIYAKWLKGKEMIVRKFI